MAMTGYTKLFASIVTSTVWREPDHVRLIWVTMLALSDKWGVVEASIPGLADMARVTIGQCQDALRVLMSEDTYSRTQVEGGKRVRAIDGGWQLINHGKYREKMSADERRVYNAEKQREHRAAKALRVSLTVNDSQPVSALSAHTDTEAEAEADTTKIKIPRAPRSEVKVPLWEQLPTEWTEWWNAYPKHKSKTAAYKAFVKARALVTFDVLLNAVKAHKKTHDWTKDNGQFIPHAASWLNKCLWEDEVTLSARPKSLGPDYSTVSDWFAECKRLHQGECEARHIHDNRMFKEQNP